MRSLVIGVAVVSCVGLAGCNKAATTPNSSSKGSSGRPTNSEESAPDPMRIDMQMLGATVELVYENDQKAPAGIDDLKRRMENAGRLIQAINDGRIVVNWNAPLNARWWAHEKDVRSTGGWMVVPDPSENGKLKPKKVSADEAKSILG